MFGLHSFPSLVLSVSGGAPVRLGWEGLGKQMWTRCPTVFQEGGRRPLRFWEACRAAAGEREAPQKQWGDLQGMQRSRAGLIASLLAGCCRDTLRRVRC